MVIGGGALYICVFKYKLRIPTFFNLDVVVEVRWNDLEYGSDSELSVVLFVMHNGPMGECFIQ